MRFFSRFNPFDFPKLIDRKNLIVRNYLLLKFYNKRREILRNSNFSDKFFKKIYKFHEIAEIRNLFFNNNIFAYSNKNEKEKIIECLKNNCSREINDYLNFGEKVIRKEFDIFEKTHKFNEKIDWHFSFFNGFRWKLQKSEKMDIRPKYKQVDVKYTWEFNRHQFLTYLGFAYYYTKDERLLLKY